MELIAENVSALAAKLGTDAGVITKFLTDAAAAAEVKPFADSLGGLEVFKPEELATRLTNERTAAALEAKNTAVGSTYGVMDKRVLDDTGVAKKAGETTIDYMARAAREKYGTQANESEELRRLRADITAKDTLLTEKDTALQQMQVAHATERKQGAINSKLDAAISALPINATPELLDSQREFVKFRLMQAYEADVVDGKVVFKDKATGQEKRDTKTASPMTAEALITEFAPKVVSLKKTSASQPSGFQPGGSNPGSASFDYGQYPTKQAFVDDMRKQGITKGSAQELKLYKEFTAARPDLT